MIIFNSKEGGVETQGVPILKEKYEISTLNCDIAVIKDFSQELL